MNALFHTGAIGHARTWSSQRDSVDVDLTAYSGWMIIAGHRVHISDGTGPVGTEE
jgi:hypothetical protein